MRKYSALQRRLHWAVALLVAGQFLLQSPMREAMDRLAATDAIDAVGFLVTTWHTLAGCSIGALMLWRWSLRRRGDGEPQRATWPPHLGTLAWIHHILLYVMVGLMVASGLLNYYAQLPLTGEVHAFGKWLLAGLVAIHVLAALWHHFIRRDAVLRNMLGSTRCADTIRDRK